MINVSQTVADKKVYFYSLDSVKNIMDLGIICAKYYTYVGEVETDLEQRGVVFHRNDGNEFFMTMKEETGVYFGKCYKLRNTNLPHVKNILEIDDFLMGKVLETIKETAKEQGLDSFRVINNCGKGAGQTVFHVHFHLLHDDNLEE